MSKNAKKEGRATEAAAPADWMEILRLDQKGLNILAKKVNLKRKNDYPVPDPVQRLILTLRYLATGEGYHESLEDMLIETLDEIFLVLKSNMESPTTKAEWQNIAKDFQTKWQVPNCLGAMVYKRVQVAVPPEFKWMFETTKGMEFTMNFTVDANYRVFLAANTFLGICADQRQVLAMVEPRLIGLPAPQAGPSGRKVPFTFVACESYKPCPWLRFQSSANNVDERRIIQQGLRPGEIAYKIMWARFGVLTSKMFVLSPESAIFITRTIATLHNYFLATNPRYAAEYKDVDQLRDNLQPTQEEEQAAPIEVAIPRRSLNEDKDWMDKMLMDMDAFQCLLRLAMPHFIRFPVGVSAPIRLRVALRFMATGKGYDQTVDMLLSITFRALDLALKDYDNEFPLPEKKWLEIATAFDRKMSLPNCVGILCSRLITLGDLGKSKGGLIGMIVDSTGRISGSRLVSKGVSYGNAYDLEEEFLKTTTFRIPANQGDKRFLFIGTKDMKPHPLLANPGNMTKAQLERGKKLGLMINEVFKDRFNTQGPYSDLAPNTFKMIKVDSRSGYHSQARLGANLVLCKMHNFLIDKSPAYGEVLKAVDN